MRLKDDFSMELEAKDCDDKHMFLKGKDSFWMFPLGTTEHGGFTTQKFERGTGFHSKIKDKYWKFLSSLLFKVEHEGEKQDLELTRIKADLSKITYFFKSNKFLLKTTYKLLENQDKASAKISFELEPKSVSDFQLVVSPLINIKNNRKKDSHFYDIDEDEGLIVSRDDKSIGFYPKGKMSINKGGERIEDLSESENPLKIGEMKHDIKNNLDFYMVSGKNVGHLDLRLVSIHDDKEGKTNNSLLEKHGIGNNTMIEKILQTRVLVAEKFITERSNMKVPEGDFGEIFERLYHDLELYKNLLSEKNLEKVFLWGSLFLSENEKNTHLNNRLWYLLSLGNYLMDDENKTLKEVFKEKVLNLLSKTDDNMMLKTPQEELKNGRVPENWENGAFLPDTNAIWINVLEKFDEITGKSHSLHIAIRSYKDVFWNKKDYLYNAVSENKEDERKNIYGLIGLSMVPNLFSQEDLENAHKVLKNGFIVKREPQHFDRSKMPFGLLDISQESEGKITTDKTPYLLNFYKHLGKENLAEQLIINLLDHQITEGALFYPHSSFKPKYESNPVPETNSISISSNYMGPFLGFMKGKK
ncbi:MAG: hypothetical protein ABEK17_04465 [Candidatus Aenigmatarchaeota archaeon]